MKSIVLVSIAIAIGLVALTGSAVATHGHKHEQGSVGNLVCNLCKGTGRSNNGTGPFKCPWCKGSGFNGSY